MKYIEDIKLDYKKVILRLDLNVPIKDGIILDDTKIRKCIPTIKYLINHKCHILIMSHLGKIKSEEDKLNNSLINVSKVLSDLLEMDVNFIPNTRGNELEESINNNIITLMENTRFEDYPEKYESNCSLDLAKYWSSLGDIFINDAFGTTHRRHASNYGISKFIESGYGFLIKEEIDGLDPIINNIDKPFTVIMGGAKVDDKIKLIESILEECDYLLVGGGIANTFLAASDKSIGSSLYSKDYVSNIKLLIDKYKNKILMPVDVVVLDGDDVITKNINDISSNDVIYDIGESTINLYKEVLNKSNTIFVNGTVGLYEDERFKKGTTLLYQSLNNTDKTIIAGGGDAVSSVNKLGFKDSFDFLSTGGGATLEYIANKKMNCFEDD